MNTLKEYSDKLRGNVAILTEAPILILGCSLSVAITHLKRLKSILLDAFNGRGRGRYYGGHSSATGSLYRGLNRIGVKASINPIFIGDYEYLVVMCSKKALGKWIKYIGQTSGRGSNERTLLAGPNIVINAKDAKEVFMHKTVRHVLVPSEWVGKGYVCQIPEMKDKIMVWFAGLDLRQWRRSSQEHPGRDRYAIVYLKSRSKDSLVSDVMKSIKRHGYEPMFMEYGSYSIGEWKRQLDGASCAIFITRSESQGIALLEAWAMDVPTFVLECGGLVINGCTYEEASAAPYLSGQTGCVWRSTAELDTMLSEYANGTRKYRPAQWVEAHMSDEHSARQFIDICEGE